MEEILRQKTLEQIEQPNSKSLTISPANTKQQRATKTTYTALWFQVCLPFPVVRPALPGQPKKPETPWETNRFIQPLTSHQPKSSYLPPLQTSSSLQGGIQVKHPFTTHTHNNYLTKAPIYVPKPTKKSAKWKILVFSLDPHSFTLRFLWNTAILSPPPVAFASRSLVRPGILVLSCSISCLVNKKPRHLTNSIYLKVNQTSLHHKTTNHKFIPNYMYTLQVVVLFSGFSVSFPDHLTPGCLASAS